MYVTAQRVADIDGPNHGINGFLYLHGEEPLPRTPEDHPDIEQIAAHPPGDRLESLESLEPGGNGVHSYLDVGVSDGCSIDTVQYALAEFGAFVPTRLESSPFQTTESVDDVGIRLYLSNRTILAPEVEYRTLAETVLQLLANHRGDASHTSLRIALEEEQDEWRFWPLSTDVDLPGPPSSDRGHALSIGRETLEAFQETRGSFFPVAAESLFGMGPEELLDHGGVEIVEANTEQLVWRGP